MSVSKISGHVPLLSLALAVVPVGAGVQAQTIDRVRMTDNDLSCQQINTDSVQRPASAPDSTRVL